MPTRNRKRLKNISRIFTFGSAYFEGLHGVIYCYEVDCLLHCLLFVSLFIVFLIGMYRLSENFDYPKNSIHRKKIDSPKNGAFR